MRHLRGTMWALTINDLRWMLGQLKADKSNSRRQIANQHRIAAIEAALRADAEHRPDGEGPSVFNPDQRKGEK